MKFELYDLVVNRPEGSLERVVQINDKTILTNEHALTDSTAPWSFEYDSQGGFLVGSAYYIIPLTQLARYLYV
jgi:hypothetical protein